MTDVSDTIAIVNDGRTKFKVWWIPQVPGKPFEVEVSSYAEGKRVEDILANYDIFQFENNIKGDYCNAGGTSYCHPDLTDGEWEDVDEFDAEEFGWVLPE